MSLWRSMTDGGGRGEQITRPNGLTAAETPVTARRLENKPERYFASRRDPPWSGTHARSFQWCADCAHIQTHTYTYRDPLDNGSLIGARDRAEISYYHVRARETRGRELTVFSTWRFSIVPAEKKSSVDLKEKTFAIFRTTARSPYCRGSSRSRIEYEPRACVNYRGFFFVLKLRDRGRTITTLISPVRR